METTKMGKAPVWGEYTVRVWFNDEWLTEGGSHRIHLDEALAQAAHMRRYGDRVRIWHATEGYIDETLARKAVSPEPCTLAYCETCPGCDAAVEAGRKAVERG
jgi:hypothetical protein